MATMTAEQMDAAEQREAEQAARALQEALQRGDDAGPTATAHYLAGSWYVVTSGTGEGYDYAYEVSDVDPDVVGAEGWDYSEWCAHTASPVEDPAVAREYHETTRHRLGTGGSGMAVPFTVRGTRIEIDALNSAGIAHEARRAGITHVELIAEGSDAKGNRATLYRLGDVRVLDTNADPVWEEEDPAGFAADLAFYGIAAATE